MTNLHRVVSGLLVALATACGAGNEYIALAPSRPAQPAERVALVFSGHVDRPYVELGMVVRSHSKTRESLTALFTEVRQAAAAQGCDAVLMNTPQWTQYWIVSGTCVAYQAPPAVVGSRN
jgi:hypothetical protein